jgi:hypothetical protein
MTKHTPGPWGVQTAGTQWAVTPMTAKGKPRHGRKTEDVCAGSQFQDNWEEDARLIADAPAMATLLRDLVAASDRNDGESLLNIINDARALLER